MEFIGLPLAIGISLLWYLPGIRAQGKNRRLHGKDYWQTALIFGLLCTCLPIIVTEVTWDAIFGTPGEGELGRNILADFFRAALLGELFKFIGFLLAKRKLRLERKIDYIMIAGLMGLVYGVVEKAVMGSPAAVIAGLLFPLHIMWQFNQGGHWFEYEKARAQQNTSLARKEWILAVFVPFLLHGCWDSALDTIIWCLGREDVGGTEILGGVLLVAAVVWAVIYMVKTMKKVLRTARESAMEEASPAEKTLAAE